MRRTLLIYFYKELTAPLLLWVAFLALLLLVMQLLRGSDVLLGSSVSAADFGRLLWFLAPHFLVMALPIAFLLATLLGMGRMSEDRELLAMQSVGLGPTQLIAVPLVLAVCVSALMLYLASGAEPRGLSAAKSVVTEVIKRNVVGDVRSGVFYEDLTNLTVYAERVNADERRWTHVLLQDDRDPSAPLLVLAREGRVEAAGGEALTLALRDGDVHRADLASEGYTLLAFERARIAVGVEDSVSQKNHFRSPKEELTPGELLQAAADAQAAGADPRPFRMHFHVRIGQALSPLSFALLGAPLALGSRPSRRRGYVVALVGYVVYYVLYRALEGLGVQGRLPLVLAGQLPNALFACVGLGVLFRLSRVGPLR